MLGALQPLPNLEDGAIFSGRGRTHFAVAQDERKIAAAGEGVFVFRSQDPRHDLRGGSALRFGLLVFASLLQDGGEIAAASEDARVLRAEDRNLGREQCAVFLLRLQILSLLGKDEAEIVAESEDVRMF